MIWRGDSFFFFLDFRLKGAMEKCAGCFLVYQFYGSLFLLKKEKWVLRDEKFGFAIEYSWMNLCHTTFDPLLGYDCRYVFVTN